MRLPRYTLSLDAGLIERCGFFFIIAAHFALLNGCPGNLVISARRIRFAPTRGFQKLGLKKLANRIAAHNGDEPPGTAASALQPDLDLDLPTGEIVGVRKDKRLGFEGLTITARDGQVSAPPPRSWDHPALPHC